MKIEVWEISQVKPYEKNAPINDAAVDAVIASIRELGVSPRPSQNAPRANVRAYFIADRIHLVRFFGWPVRWHSAFQQNVVDRTLPIRKFRSNCIPSDSDTLAKKFEIFRKKERPPQKTIVFTQSTWPSYSQKSAVFTESFISQMPNSEIVAPTNVGLKFSEFFLDRP